MPVDLDHLEQWQGRTREVVDTLDARQVAGLCAALDYPVTQAVAGQALPAGWHWLYFHEAVAASGIAADGHPRRGDFLPPVPLPRRMWAGGRLAFRAPLRVGDTVRRTSTIASVEAKQGRSGALVFVKVAHEYFRDSQLCLQEEQDLVYREAAVAAAPAAQIGQPRTCQFSRSITPDVVLLFRYSALTFNAHRIHYDRDYAVNEEHYPGLVVQGPLTATLLLDLLRRQHPDRGLAAFEFRGLRPLIVDRLLSLRGEQDAPGVRLWAEDDRNAVAMEALAQWRR